MAHYPTPSSSSKDFDVAEECIRLHQKLAGSRGNFESQWQEIAERVWPSNSRSFNSTSGYQNNGQKTGFQSFDSTASIALNRFSAILDSLLTPRNQTWHKLVPTDPYLAKDRNVMLWFEEVTRLLFRYRYSPKSNFSSQNQQVYKSLGAFGTGCMFIDPLGAERGIRYRNLHLGEIYFRENHQGIVDTAVRYFRLTIRQAIQKWGDKLPSNMRDAAKNDPEKEFAFIHCVRPNDMRDPEAKDYRGMAFASYYVSVEGKVLLGQSGYATFPYAISRYEQSPGEIYGRSPAMDVLPAIKTLNEEKKTVLKQGHRTVDPVLLAHDDGLLDGFSLKPGAINYGGVDSSGRPLVHALPVGNIQVGKEMMDDERSAINDVFLVNIFQILVESPQMTATEVMERAKEKGILLAPTVGRQQSEYLGPMIEREVAIMADQGLLPPLPPILREYGAEYLPEYDSPLSRAQRAEEASGLMRTVEMAVQVASQTQNPEPLDWFNWDEIVPEVSQIQGVPPKWMRSLEQVQAIRQGRNDAQARQEMMQGAPGAAAIMKSTAALAKARAV